jgi:hypothetical protein
MTDSSVPARAEPAALALNHISSDDHLADELLISLADDYRYATDLRAWIVRDGPRWVPCRDGVLPWIAACVSRTEVNPVIDRPDVRKWARQGYPGGPFVIHSQHDYTKITVRPEDYADWTLARELRHPARQARLAALMRSKAPDDNGLCVMAVAAAGLDCEPGILWAGGMPVDLARSADGPVWAEDTGVPWEATWPHMLSSDYRPDPDVPVPMWDRLTEAVFPDINEREHALNALAHGFHGYPTAAAILARSATGTGKSFIATLLSDLLGDYAGQVSASTLFGRSGSSQFAFDEMGGARFVVMNEGRKADFAATEAFKAVVGPDPLVNARARHERTRRLIPARHTMMLTVNPAADLDYADPAIRRRLIPLGFTGNPVKIAEIAARYGTASPEGLARWQAEAPGVLARMIARCAHVLEEPSFYGTKADVPESAAARFDAVAAEADPFGRWLDERTCDGLPTSNGDLLADYRKWCEAAGVTPMGGTWFGRAMASAGIDPGKLDRGHRGWKIALRDRRH